MDTLFAWPIKDVLRPMMQDSDNFLAEQLLIMSAWKNGFSDLEEFRDFVNEQWLPDINPVWVDGSGLSRYNLARPIDQVRLLDRIYKEYGWETIEQVFAQGGVNGTIEEWYANTSLEGTNESRPYVYAKTGTLSNNHCLSGYLVTESDNLLIFSFMNNNYVRQTNEIKQEMQHLLEAIRDAY